MRVFRNTKTSQTRYFVPFVSGLVALFFVSSTAIAQDTTQPDTLLTPAQWRSFEQNVAAGIRSENAGVQESALGQITKFGEFMDFTRDDVITVVRLYRDAGAFRNRQMAITAIGSMNDRWGIEFLDMLSATETSDQLKRSMKAIVDAYWEKNGGNPYTEN